MSVSFNLICDFRILLENVFQKELFGECETFNHFFTFEYEFTSKVIDNVVITDDKHLNELLYGFEIVFSFSARSEEIPNRDNAFKTEVHFWDFIFFVVNNFVIFFIFRVKLSW